jgi:hypothetical protein
MPKQRKGESAFAFFLANAGYGYDQKKETAEQGKRRCARALARAERWLAAQPGHEIEWQEEDYPDQSSIEHNGPVWCVFVRLANKESASLFGIDFGEHGDPSNDYARVVVAELALELMGD